MSSQRPPHPPSPSPSPKHYLNKLKRASQLPTSASDTRIARTTTSDKSQKIKPFILRSTSPYPSPPTTEPFMSSSLGSALGLGRTTSIPDGFKGKKSTATARKGAEVMGTTGRKTSATSSRAGSSKPSAGTQSRKWLATLENQHYSSARFASGGEEMRRTSLGDMTNGRSSPPVVKKKTLGSIANPSSTLTPQKDPKKKSNHGFDLGFRTPSPKVRAAKSKKLEKLTSVPMERSLASQGVNSEYLEGKGKGKAKEVGYSSLQDMLESSGFTDTRVITPVQTLHRKPKSSPPPVLDSSSPNHTKPISPSKKAVDSLRLNSSPVVKTKASLLSMFRDWASTTPHEQKVDKCYASESSIGDIDNDLVNCGSVSSQSALSASSQKEPEEDERTRRAREWAEAVARETVNTNLTVTGHPARETSTSSSSSSLTIRPATTRKTSLPTTPTRPDLAFSHDDLLPHGIRHTFSDPNLSNTYQSFAFTLDDENNVLDLDTSFVEDYSPSSSCVRIEYGDLEDSPRRDRISSAPINLGGGGGASKSIGFLKEFGGGLFKRASQMFVWGEEEKVAEEKEVPRLLRQKSAMLKVKSKAQPVLSTGADFFEGLGLN